KERRGGPGALAQKVGERGQAHQDGLSVEGNGVGPAVAVEIRDVSLPIAEEGIRRPGLVVLEARSVRTADRDAVIVDGDRVGQAVAGDVREERAAGAEEGDG